MAIEGRIKTIVVLVMENRSFDHMLGWMNSLNSEIAGVTGQEWNPISTTDPNSEKIYFKNNSQYVDPDPGHSFQAIREQVFGKNADIKEYPDPPPMNGFAQNAESVKKGMSENVMDGFKPDAIPVYKALVSEFAVFDHWFASVPAATQPNRLYVHSATSHGATSNNTLKLLLGYPQKTIFECVHESGLDFGIYYQYPPSTLFYRNLRRLKYLSKFHQYDLHFKNDAKKGKLPEYVVVEQRYFDLKILPGNDDHPSHDVAEGQKFVKEVYETLRSSPQWEHMLFIITYDEHGGFYDHVPTPVKDVPSPDDIVGEDPYKFKFDRLGVRVPTIMISPWIQKGTVVHTPPGPYPSSQYEHSSIPATVKKLLNLKSDFLTKRDAWAGTFDHILTVLDNPRTDCPETLPTPTKLRKTAAKEKAVLNDFQKDLVSLGAQLGGEIKPNACDAADELCEKINVKEARALVDRALKRFFEYGQQALERGEDDSHIMIPPYKKHRDPAIKSFFENALACVACKSNNE